MKPESYKIFSLGVDALTLDFGNEISTRLNDKVVNLAEYLEKSAFTGIIETVPAYSSLTIFFDVPKIRKTFPEFSTAFEAVKQLAENALQTLAEKQPIKPRLIEI